ncbi:hypothetical protein CPB84DRAFT_1798104 [Gymnopilus junonius]|uniref:SnoaL-like domain-containing protein n=1 Tax=Gymnopilus junonius TaxID=109634 RepID=A0A9P5TFB3_GYMJU|nr:hypothetical protein CPB84DRAFT_1798104 [Gymnopilus junonius]
MPHSREQLLKSAQNFCSAFSEKRSVEEILSHFSVTHEVSAIEYGAQTLAPFLGRQFLGISGVKQYFDVIGSLLSYENVSFSEYMVDAVSLKVSVKGRGRFTWLSTSQSWDETFTYTLDFDDELKLVRYQVWADSGSAYLAKLGKLAE